MLDYKDLKDKRKFNRQLIVPALRKAGQVKLADKIAVCSEVSDIAICKTCGERYFAGSYYCKSRFCSICAKLRAMAWLAKLVPLFNDYIEKGYKIFKLNLTIKDQDDLKVGLQVLTDAWRIMTNGDKSNRRTFKSLNVGGVRSIEVKIGENSGQWHPHIHAMVLCPCKRGERVKAQFADYRKLWERSVVSAFKGKLGSEKLGSIDISGIRKRDNNLNLMGAIVETFKYISKFEWLDLEPKRINELIEQTKGRHFISSWGLLYGLNKQVDELLEQTSADVIKEKVCEICGCTEFELEHVLTDLTD